MGHTEARTRTTKHEQKTRGTEDREEQKTEEQKTERNRRQRGEQRHTRRTAGSRLPPPWPPFLRGTPCSHGQTRLPPPRSHRHIGTAHGSQHIGHSTSPRQSPSVTA